jgi:chaperonin GroEL (HSP60 family)
MTKQFTNFKILLLNVELELNSEKENAEVRITSPEAYQSIVDAEWQVIYDKLDACIAVGANIVLSKLPIELSGYGRNCAIVSSTFDAKASPQTTNCTNGTGTSTRIHVVAETISTLPFVAIIPKFALQIIIL